MGTAALVLGIISIMVSLVPFLGVIAFFPALVGIILGTINLVLRSRKKQAKGTSVVGVIFSLVSIIIIIFWFVLLGISLKSGAIQREVKKFNENLQIEVQNDLNDL